MEERSFTDISLEIADKFIRDIVFIDEQAYDKTSDNTEETDVHNNEFDAKAVSDAFLKKGKICAIYAPLNEDDLQKSIVSLLKADVVVLDWNLNLANTTDYNPEEDDESENRGYYTKKLIAKLIKNASSEKVKLIVVYTGETDLNEITEQIYRHIKKDIALNNKGNCFISSKENNIRILIRAKETSKFNHIPKLKSKIVKYDKLPDFIIKEFSKITFGLLTNYALSAITAIRDNTSNILGIFSKDIDPAFLGHYVSIPDSNNAVSMLSEIFGSAIADLIDSSDLKIQTWIDAWLTQNVNKSFTTKIGKNELTLSKELLKNIVKSSETKFKNKLQACFPTKKINGDEDYLKKDAIKLFKTKLKKPNYKLAKLVQHSNLFSPPNRPRLTTGTIVKYEKTPKHWNFLLCIQQSCDSVRISPKEKRTFLFLPLTQDTKGEAVITEENKHLIVDNRSYSLESHKFSPTNNNETLIIAKKIKNKYVFQDSDKKQFIWVAELKKLFAQHIVSAYASQLSRVGIDNSEWIRLMGKLEKENRKEKRKKT